MFCVASKWDDMELLLRYGMEENMRVNPQDHALFFSQNTLMNTSSDTAKLLEMCFESLQAPAMHSMSSATLSGFSAGRPTCMVVEVGASGTTITPVIDGYTIKKALVRSLVVSYGSQNIHVCVYMHAVM